MKTKTTLDLSQLDLPLESYFSSLSPSKHSLRVAQIPMNDYRDLLFKIESLLNVCILALDNENAANHSHIPQPDVNVQAVLEMAAQLLPLAEAEFLDGVREKL